MTQRRKASPETDEAVYQEIARALMEGRLRAGMKLGEHRLAEVFGVSRERIRKVLHRLGAERRVEIISNRGARVPKPSEADVKAIYEAHRVLEAGVLRELGRVLDDGLLALMDGHLAEESAAAERGDRAESVRLSGAFHVHLVDALGNAELSRILRDLLSRSSVMVSLYEAASQSVCAVDEHGSIVEALRQGRIDEAIERSHHHFVHVEQRLRLESGEAAEPDLADVFAVGPSSRSAAE